jgi:hypothetical protein
MALVPVMGVDLYELANNHLWRTEFGFRRWGEPPPEYMRVETDAGGITERGWIDYGFKNYYALLNSGFRLRPTAGTASGVHPVPLGFSRVYVHLTGGLSAEAWMRGLDAGKSFVTTGPMLFLEVDRPLPGSTTARVAGSVLSAAPLSRVEVLLNGQVAGSPPPGGAPNAGGARECRFAMEIELPGTSWIAARAFEEAPGGRVRFAHSAPVFLEVEGKPLRPRPEEAEFLKGRVSRELERSKDLLPPEALEEYRRALAAYDEAVKRAAGGGER